MPLHSAAFRAKLGSTQTPLHPLCPLPHFMLALQLHNPGTAATSSWVYMGWGIMQSIKYLSCPFAHRDELLEGESAGCSRVGEDPTTFLVTAGGQAGGTAI